MNPKTAFLYIIIHVTVLTFGEVQTDSIYYCNSSAGDSTYLTNLNSLISLISSNVAALGFYNLSFGQNPRIAYLTALCEGNIELDTCHSCVVKSAIRLKESCSDRKQAIGWYDKCMLRYSNNSIYHDLKSKPYCYAGENTSSWNNVVQFNSTMNSFMSKLRGDAAGKSSKFASGTKTYADNVTIIGLVQCMPDLSEEQCNICLNNVLGVLSKCLLGKVKGKAATPSCNMRYESSRAPAAALPINPVRQKGRKRKKIAITACISASLVGGALLGICFICYRRRKSREARELRENWQEVQLLDVAGEMFTDEQDLPLLPLDVIRTATQQFSKENKLGEGGFGPVYKGTLVDGKEIAVKRLSKNSSQGLQEFKAEITLIARLQHRNLVSLLGCCMQGKEMLLVYDYMPNGSLEAILFDSNREARLDWKMRHRIIKGIARGMLYLHEDSRLKIIHRDLKSSNVLLDNEFNPRISDFGMARTFGSDQSEANTKRVVGTFGYMAPEYVMQGTISVKSDVFSFGVLLLEIISGTKTSRFHLSGHGQSLLTFAWKLWSNEHELELMDPLLKQTYAENDVLRCIHIALLCVQEDPADRPTMSSVVFMLENDTIALPRPTEPAFFLGRKLPCAAPQIIPNDVGSAINEITFSALSPR